MSPPYIGWFVYHGALSCVDCEERNDVAIYFRSLYVFGSSCTGTPSRRALRREFLQGGDMSSPTDE